MQLQILVVRRLAFRPLFVHLSNPVSHSTQTGADVNARDDLEAPLIIAAKVGNDAAVVALLQVGGE